jgi:hypothetical protein
MRVARFVTVRNVGVKDSAFESLFGLPERWYANRR